MLSARVDPDGTRFCSGPLPKARALSARRHQVIAGLNPKLRKQGKPSICDEPTLLQRFAYLA